MFESKLARVVVALVVIAGSVVGGKYYFAARETADAKEAAITAARDGLLDEGGPAAAIPIAMSGLEQFPDEPELHLVRGIGLIARNRASDAEEALTEALRLQPESELLAEIDFHLARTRVFRFLDLGDRGDLNQAEGPLESLRGDLRFDASVDLLLGLAHLKAGKDAKAAKDLIRKGIGGTLAPGAEADAERGRAALNAP